jgi:hypothetical protein
VFQPGKTCRRYWDTTIFLWIYQQYYTVGKQGCVPARQHLQPELGHHNLPADIPAILYSWEAGLCSSQATSAAGTGPDLGELFRIQDNLFNSFWMLYRYCSGLVFRCFFNPWIRDPGWEKNLDPDPRGTSQIIFPKQFSGLKILQFFDADPGSGIFLTLDLGSGMEKLGSGFWH